MRPNRLQLKPAGGKGVIPGTLRKATYVGSHMEYMVETELGELFATSEEVSEEFQQGDRVGLALARTGPVLVPKRAAGSSA